MIPLNEVVSFIFHQSSVVVSDVCVGILFQNERRPYASYMESQPEINEKMRATLVDWLVLVHTKYEFSLETLYLTINIIDRFHALQSVPRKELQLVGITAMLMASKYEETLAPMVSECCVYEIATLISTSSLQIGHK